MTAEQSDTTVPDSVTGTPGPRVRQLRTDRGMGLRELASLTGTTPSFISQFERGESGASIATLVRIAEALGINLADLFTQRSPAGRVTRLGRHPAIQSAGYRKILLTPPPLQAIEGYRLEFDEGEGTGDEPYTHGDAQEIVTVIDGAAEVTIGEEKHVLQPGDTAEYRTSTPHAIRNAGTGTAIVLVITSPPTVTTLDIGPQIVPGT
ncbi:helix-turn-helix domain-containing protein [Micrococcus sp. TA1]|uniref:helix-turn-helix domain-containing protein n=1 Tax=Micrococcus sp. TA1 TaxID=681627 RepID=UPI00161EA26B|nr:XRE family transcriptional regulator [Micrococcus sp. TA1]MBB5750158.1 transcriptional regulator with XRE-family HTH domain [Micrococcus sp. TA1]